jgi:endonuclease/exonuclease/phosphatase (EEP) superfamily protein YafD
VAAWPLLIGVVGVLLLRQRGAGRPETVALVGFTPALAVPLALVALGAWRGRSPTLRVATAAVVAYFLAAMNPVSAVVGCGGTTADDAITVYTANVLAGGGRPNEVADSILASGADVFLLQEVTTPFLDELRSDPRMVDAYPHHSEPDHWAHSGRVIWSRWPLSDVVDEPFVVSRLVSATVESPQGSFRVGNVHTQAPSADDHVWAWRDQFDQLGRIDTTTPGLLAGDFNATADHRPLRDLLARGWTDVHEPKGCGFDATWPVDERVPTPFYRLDHVLVTDHFEVLDVGFGQPAGSDHLPVVTDLRLTTNQIRSRAIGPVQPGAGP